RARARLLAALVTTCHPAFTSLLLAGFLPGPHRFRVLTRTFSPEVAERERNARWCITWGETDHL
ncbi:MAG TPA: hypothetical protein VFL80_08215, partial [Thermoanaerobaculia bacterium]|nr:hypothetical protein [Thermoanaerobaculia bacterium]